MPKISVPKKIPILSTPDAPLIGTSQQQLPIADIAEDIVLYKDGGASLVLESTSLNFGLLSEREQEAVIAAYAALLNSLSFPMQIVVKTQKKDISRYLNFLDDAYNRLNNDQLKGIMAGYKNFIKDTIRKKNVLGKRFFMVIPFYPSELGLSASLKGFNKKTTALPYAESYIIKKAKISLDPKRDHLVRQASRLGLKLTQLDTTQLTKLFYEAYNPYAELEASMQAKEGEIKPKIKDPVSAIEGGMNPVDVIAPPNVELDFDSIKVGGEYYRTLFVAGYPRFVTPGWLEPIVNFDQSLDISFFIYPVEGRSVLDDLRRKITEMEAEISTDIQRGRILNPGTEAKLEDAKSLQEQLVKGAQRFYEFSFYITLHAPDLEQLNTITKRVESTLGSVLLVAKHAILDMEKGFISSIPMGRDQLSITRNMDTTSLATTFPFTTAELSADTGILYGINSQNESFIIFDRFNLENSNMTVFATSGAGKSFFVKLESLRTLMLGTEAIIIDPEHEYEALCRAVGGQYISFSSGSPSKINPFDLTQIYEEGEDQLGLKVLSLHSLFKVIMGELTPNQEALLDRAIIGAYRARGITQDPATQKKEPPLIEDLYKALIGMEIKDSMDMAARLEKFVKGSYVGIFDQHTNIDLKNPYTVFSVRDVEDSMRPIVMFIILDFIWTRVRRDIRKRLLIVDEAWHMMRYKDTAQFLWGIVKRARKYYLGLTTITQDVEDFLSQDIGKAVVTNSALRLLLKQSPAAIDRVADTFYLSQGEKQLLLAANVGEGILFAGPHHAPIKIVASQEEYDLVTTKPQDIMNKKPAVGLSQNQAKSPIETNLPKK